MAVSKQMLGMNARNFLFIKRFNRSKKKGIADNKLLTKQAFIKAKVPIPDLLAILESFDDARTFDWTSLPKSFVIKPASGYGGQGILVVRGWDGSTGRASGRDVGIEELESHIFDVIDGAFSLGNVHDTAFIEERVIPNPMFKKLGATGVSDIRIIVCNGVPVMGMLRIPTDYSDGKANLHQGAIGIGIDMRSGITTYGTLFNKPTLRMPGTKTKVRGIKLPHWDDILTIAINATKAVHLGYSGIDIVLDKKKGPLVLEANVRPGLTIQLANQASLRTRLERIDDVQVSSPQEAVELAKTLFAEKRFADEVQPDNVLHLVEKVTLIGPKKRKTVMAKIDTGAFRTAIDDALVEELELPAHEQVIKVRASLGKAERPTVDLKLKIRGKEIESHAAHTDRSHMRFPVIIGRKDLKGFLVDPSKKKARTRIMKKKETPTEADVAKQEDREEETQE